MSETRTLLILVVIILIIVAVPILQIYLSKRKSKWPGLILPIIFIILSIVSIYNVPAFSDREPVKKQIIEYAISFILNNIPTIILLGIYIPYRQDLKKNKGLEKQL